MPIAEIIEEQITFPSGSLKLAGILAYPDGREPIRSILLCSPHPHFAGDMENNVIQHLARHLARDSATLRFDYRGVGTSQIKLADGTGVFDYWQQVEESRDYRDALQDVQSAWGELRSNTPVLPCIIVGYSFGAVVGFRFGMDQSAVWGLIGIAPPVGKVDFDFLDSCDKPGLMICGREDFLYTPDQLDRFRQSCGRRTTLMIRDHSDHFFRGEEEHLANEIETFIARQLCGEGKG
jgi:uncharacterized protein